MSRHIPRHPQGRDVTALGVAVEQPDDELFSVDGRHRGNPRIDLTLLEWERESTVLRLAFVGDVHGREELDARDERVVDIRRDARMKRYDAVDAQSNASPARIRLDVYVACVRRDGAREHRIDATRDGRISEPRVSRERAGRRLTCVRVHKALTDLVARHPNRLDLESRRSTHLIENIRVVDVGKRHMQQAVREREWQHVMAKRECARQACDSLGAGRRYTEPLDHRDERTVTRVSIAQLYP
jgi:hypothetical protein